MDQRSTRAAKRAAFEVLEHPGDMKLRAWGPTLGQLFINAAEGMMTYLFGEQIARAQPKGSERIEITSSDREALLVDWLSEILYRVTSEYQAYIGFRIDEIDDRRLVATAGTVSAEATDDIKAVTHHELSIRKQDDGWDATVVFDI
jgi:SHS2 domain-containing protein